MTKEEHHYMCLGLLADIHQRDELTLPSDQLIAIEQAIESAQYELKMDVSVEKLKKGFSISTRVEN